MFVGNLPADASENTVQAMFSEFGKVRSIRLISDVFTGKCKGTGIDIDTGKKMRDNNNHQCYDRSDTKAYA